MATLPDILHASPSRRIDGERTKLAVVMALAGGTSGGLFAEALDGASVAPSSWRPSEFAEALFLQRFVGFAVAQSGLRRLSEFGSEVQASEPYQALSDLLQCDARLATVDVRVGVGADGRVSGFEVLSVQESNWSSPC